MVVVFDAVTETVGCWEVVSPAVSDVVLGFGV